MPGATDDYNDDDGMLFDNDGDYDLEEELDTESKDEDDGLDEALAALTADEEDDSVTPDATETARAMMTEMSTALNSSVLPDDMIPDDFNANDPAALRSLMTRVMRHTMTTVIPLALKPVQMAMQSQAATFESTLAQRLAAYGESNNSEAKLRQQFPLLDDKRFGAIYRPYVDMMNKKKIPMDKQLQQLRSMQKRLGHENVKPVRNSAGGSNSGNRVLDGQAALNAIFGKLPPAPKPKPKPKQ